MLRSANTPLRHARFDSRLASRSMAMLICFVGMMVGSGCSALRPIVGVPAYQLPPQYRASVRTGQELIDLSRLRQSQPADYRVDSGDVLGIYIEGILGNEGTVPPVLTPNGGDLRPSLGYPIEVERDGTISLPAAGAIPVRGLTLDEVRERIRRVFTDELQLLRPDVTRVPVLVTLQKGRTYRVLVIRQEAGQDAAIDLGADSNGLGIVRRGIGRVVELPAYENDVLHALAATGGLPGLDAENTVCVVRGAMCGQCRPDGFPWAGHSVAPQSTGDPNLPDELASHPEVLAFQGGGYRSGAPQVLRIPLRAFPGNEAHFSESDIILADGDVVYIESRVDDFFYTGGLLGGGQFQLPRDYDIDPLEALAIVQGQSNGNNGQSRAIGGFSALNKDVTVGASKMIILRPRPDGTNLPIEIDLYEAVHDPVERVVIQPGDYLVLQYTKKEAIAAFFERHVFEGLILGVSSALVFN
ncbi:polysaccharide biosynthesis/export family protein [Stratiformator vulcanicus]|uniref:Polysaccharide biosynthesis/export protein n=1 Tax=Stratiformator vulcanicus TaxID=2527980 RepID=A0A517R5U8_9PLAN|nr:polysaccharide biosynthesis/export family protein [Stratiformator vulcanicus]QDT39242.1 Polysaccharide biosynthesis/export protein [Stratiformator vulcanicus]